MDKIFNILIDCQETKPLCVKSNRSIGNGKLHDFDRDNSCEALISSMAFASNSKIISKQNLLFSSQNLKQLILKVNNPDANLFGITLDHGKNRLKLIPNIFVLYNQSS
ncbi:hypothetical protein BpHYR1_035229 [Brachionus plicatilis]|uniref:Uncharacterized protein n=1 Tax=Brachionus plicatilis TaxID=10195 RepID=A0A3M7T961_BRAPC|nr:hypothetical protein BpHYR1_035229 [Brachionus plicatilis]